MHMYNTYSELSLIKEARSLQFSIKSSDLEKFLNLVTHYCYYFYILFYIFLLLLLQLLLVWMQKRSESTGTSYLGSIPKSVHGDLGHWFNPSEHLLFKMETKTTYLLGLLWGLNESISVKSLKWLLEHSLQASFRVRKVSIWWTQAGHITSPSSTIIISKIEIFDIYFASCSKN